MRRDSKELFPQSNFFLILDQFPSLMKNNKKKTLKKNSEKIEIMKKISKVLIAFSWINPSAKLTEQIFFSQKSNMISVSILG